MNEKSIKRKKIALNMIRFSQPLSLIIFLTTLDFYLQKFVQKNTLFLFLLPFSMSLGQFMQEIIYLGFAKKIPFRFGALYSIPLILLFQIAILSFSIVITISKNEEPPYPDAIWIVMCLQICVQFFSSMYWRFSDFIIDKQKHRDMNYMMGLVMVGIKFLTYLISEDKLFIQMIILQGVGLAFYFATLVVSYAFIFKNPKIYNQILNQTKIKSSTISNSENDSSAEEKGSMSPSQLMQTLIERSSSHSALSDVYTSLVDQEGFGYFIPILKENMEISFLLFLLIFQQFFVFPSLAIFFKSLSELDLQIMLFAFFATQIIADFMFRKLKFLKNIFLVKIMLGLRTGYLVYAIMFGAIYKGNSHRIEQQVFRTANFTLFSAQFWLSQKILRGFLYSAYDGMDGDAWKLRIYQSKTVFEFTQAFAVNMGIAFSLFFVFI